MTMLGPFVPKHLPHHIEAEVTFLTEAEGGRKAPVRSGYRGQFCHDGEDCDAVYDFGTDEGIEMGRTAHTRVWFMRPERHLANMHPGKAFLVREGYHVVARGVVTSFVQPTDTAAPVKQGPDE